MKKIDICTYSVDTTGKILATKEIQQAIDDAAKEHIAVFFPKGIYLVGSLFLRNHSELIFEEGATLLGSTDSDDFPEIFSRVAGVEMSWPAAIINAIDVADIKISGKGIIDGQGPYWWNLYWGEDQVSGQRAQYDAAGLRFIADYAIKRPRSILFQGVQRSTIQEITLQRAGFWNLQLTYCEDILVKELTIRENHGPSTDGIDIDSSKQVHVTGCHLSCGDDCIAIKSGRDGDGLRVARASEEIEIDHCHIYSGYGITIGSEVSGNIVDVYIHDITFTNSDCGIRMKSAKERGGIIKDIRVENITMYDVQFPFSWIMDWHTAYNRKGLVTTELEKFPFYQAVALDIPEAQQMTKVQNVFVKNVTATLSDDYAKVSRAFDLVAFEEKPMERILFENCHVIAQEFGRIEAVKELQLAEVVLTIAEKNGIENNQFDTR